MYLYGCINNFRSDGIEIIHVFSVWAKPNENLCDLCVLCERPFFSLARCARGHRDAELSLISEREIKQKKERGSTDLLGRSPLEANLTLCDLCALCERLILSLAQFIPRIGTALESTEAQSWVC